MALTAAEKAKLVKASATITFGEQSCTVHGSLGNLEWLGLTANIASNDMGLRGESRVVTRRGGRRSRWLGDLLKNGFAGSTAEVAFYPSSRGLALPGTPITVVNTRDFYPGTTNRISATVQIDGPIGVFNGYMNAHELAFPIQIYGKTGNKYKGLVPAD
jgi:hypothetical protein